MSATMDRETTAAEAINEDDGATGDVVAGRSSRPRWPWVLVVIVVVAATAVAVNVVGGDDAAADAEAASAVNVAEVVRTDLVEVESFDATLGTVPGDPITTQRGGTITSAIEAGETAVAGDVIYTVDGEPVVLMYGATPVWREIRATEDLRDLTNRLNGTVTGVVEPGTVLEEGDIAYWVNGEPVVVLYGDVPAYRTMNDASTNLEGDDIAQLETYLDENGFDDVVIALSGGIDSTMSWISVKSSLSAARSTSSR